MPIYTGCVSSNVTVEIHAHNHGSVCRILQTVIRPLKHAYETHLDMQRCLKQLRLELDGMEHIYYHTIQYFEDKVKYYEPHDTVLNDLKPMTLEEGQDILNSFGNKESLYYLFNRQIDAVTYWRFKYDEQVFNIRENKIFIAWYNYHIRDENEKKMKSLEELIDMTNTYLTKKRSAYSAVYEKRKKQYLDATSELYRCMCIYDARCKLENQIKSLESIYISVINHATPNNIVFINMNSLSDVCIENIISLIMIEKCPSPIDQFPSELVAQYEISAPPVYFHMK